MNNNIKGSLEVLVCLYIEMILLGVVFLLTVYLVFLGGVQRSINVG